MELKEVSLEIEKNGQYNNLNFKGFKDDGSYIIVEKDGFADGYKLDKLTINKNPMYSLSLIYKDTKCKSLLFSEGDADNYASAGGVGDKVKIIFHKEFATNAKDKDYVKKTLVFEKV